MNPAQRSWVRAFGLAAGVVLTLPLLLMPLQRRFYQSRFPAESAAWTLNGSFSPVESFHMDVDVYPYAARMAEAGTHALPGDPHAKENGSVRLLLRDLFSFQILGAFYRLGGGIPRGWTLAQLVLSAAWVPLLFALLVECGADAGAALALAVLLTVFDDLTRLPFTVAWRSLPTSAAQYSAWLLGSYNYWFGPTRFTRPLLTYPCLFGAALFAVRAARSRQMRTALAAGVFGGALAYVHPDVWAGYVGATGLLFAFLCWKERRLDPALAASLLVTAALSAPWAASSFFLGAREDVGLAWAAGTRLPDWTALPYLAVAWLAWRERRGSLMLAWCACLLAASAAFLNVHVLTGSRGHPSLWWYLGNCFAALVLGKLLFDRLSLSASAWRGLAACFLLAGVPRALGYSITHYKLYALPLDQEKALTWLRDNAPKDAVVAALSPTTVYRLPIYARKKTLASMIFPLTSDISFAENAARLKESLEVFGVTPARFVDYGLDPSGQWERKLWLGEVDEESHERSGLIGRYFLDITDRARLLALLDPALSANLPYDYVWVGPFERALLPGGRLPRWFREKPVFESGAYAIYPLGSGDFNSAQPRFPAAGKKSITR